MKQLWKYNSNFPLEPYGPTSHQQKADHPEDWAGYKVRMMLQLAYIVSMLCLLRYDETLRIQWGDVEFEEPSPGLHRVKLSLPFRKTHQNGGMCLLNTSQGCLIMYLYRCSSFLFI